MKLHLYLGLSSTREPSGSRKLLKTAQSQRRVSTVLPAQPEMTAVGKSLTEGSPSRLEDCRWVLPLPCMAPSHQGTPGTGRTAGNDIGYGSKERVGLETAQNKNLDFLGKSCFSAGVEDTCRFPDLWTKTLCGHLPVLAVASGTSGSRTPQQQKVCETLLVPWMVSVPLIFQTLTTELDCKTGRN